MEGDRRGKVANTKVKNKAPAETQITAEQLLREAKERELEVVPPPPKQKISDPEELADYQLRKRKFFEDNIRKNRMVISNWLKYAAWEESQKEIQRARSVFERALDITVSRNITIWLKYLEMEMKNRQVNHARNLFDRAVAILPRVDQFWYKYVYFEEILNNVPACRQVFERWMKWWPDEQAWQTYIKFEMRYQEIDRARNIYSQFVMLHPDVKNWIKFARFEERNSGPENARKVYEFAVEFFGDTNLDEKLFIAFAKFEESQHEYERVRTIFKFALEKLPKDKAPDLYHHYTLFEKKHGAQKGIEALITTKRKLQYEQNLAKDPHDYDTWFDYIRLAENELELEEVREIYERAVANVPNQLEKRAWRRYIYLWIYRAVFEELDVEDIEKAREVYEFCIDKLIPHKKFTFAKIWLMAAKFEIRQGDIKKARKILGNAIGRCPKGKLFKEYIELEIQMREFDNCRRLYGKYLEFNLENSAVWVSYAELESILGEVARARGIYKLAIDRPRLDIPEVVWKAYIDFEADLGNNDEVVQLYEELLLRTKHVKVWACYAQFFENLKEYDRARSIYERAHRELSDEPALTRLLLLESWQDFEKRLEEDGRDITHLMPTKVRKRRKLAGEDEWEEYCEYIFPSGEKDNKTSKLLEKAKLWKSQNNSTTIN